MKDQKLTSFIDGAVELEDWTFLTANIREKTHGFHTYPARMIPQVARALIDKYSPSNTDVCLDPYCGSGTVLVESKLKGRKSFGIDANPLAILLARVKTTSIDDSALLKTRTKLYGAIVSDITSSCKVEMPSIKNLDFWFKPSVSYVLAIIRKNIFEIEDPAIQGFFRVCFSLTVRKVSNNRQGEFKLYRLDKDRLEKHNPDVLEVFTSSVKKNIDGMKAFAAEAKDVPAIVFKGDSRNLTKIAPDYLHEGSVNLLVTSPPYGDSHTTVAYGQFSRYMSLWLGFDPDEVLKVDKNGLGGKVFDKMDDLESPTLVETVEAIRKLDDL